MGVLLFEGQQRERLAPGVERAWLQPGGKDGPDGIVPAMDQPGGGAWTDVFALGAPDDPWRLLIPDIRMAANQLWPMHWHDCWTAVVVLDGTVMVGDWWMRRGDVLIAPAGVEYGPLLNGPRGCQLLEIFARDVLSPGGYSSEYHDHPTLQFLGSPAASMERPPTCAGNAGNQTSPIDRTPGAVRAHLDGLQRLDLGEPDDPERGVLLDRVLRPGEAIGARRPGDWRASLVLAGAVTVGERTLEADDLLLIEPGAEVPPVMAGPDGAHLVDLARTIAALGPEDGGPELSNIPTS